MDKRLSASPASLVNRGERVWRPAPSTGPALGLAITATTLVCTLVLLGAGLATTSTATRAACIVGVVTGAVVFLGTALATWWCWTLRYALTPAALEVRYGSSLLRLRHEEIDEVVGRSREERPRVPTLWPGAHFGRGSSSSGEMEVWRGTTRETHNAVVVSARGARHAITPSDPGPFREELIQYARSVPYVGSHDGRPRLTWIDAIAIVDSGVRGLLLTAGVVATAGIAADVARFGASQRDGMSAAVILLVNGVAGVPLSVRWRVIARLLAAGAVASQVLALF